MKEYISVPESSLLRGEGLSFDELALVEPLAIGAHGVRRADVKEGEFVLVVGTGPIGLGIVEFARIAGGNVIARYTFGLGLVSQINAAGTPSYYDFDALGSTAGLTNAVGSYVNTYSYLPFGGMLTSSLTVANPFRFVGKWGAITENNDFALVSVR